MNPMRPTVRPAFQRTKVSGTVTAPTRPLRAPARTKAVKDIRPTLIPCRRATTGLMAQARMARPNPDKRNRTTIPARAAAVVAHTHST